ncbi:MAG: efflux transporter outer membrane subunit [Propionivibrio sp.]
MGAHCKPEIQVARNRPRSFALPFALGLALSACAPFAERPGDAAPVASLTAPAAWTRTDPALETSAATPESLAGWWRQFGDAQLDALIDEAMAAAPDVRTARARLRQSRASSDLAVANLYPTIGASASATRSRTGTDAGGNDVARTMYRAGFDASWEPSIFGGLRDAADGAAADVAAAEALLDSARASLAAEVALNYVNLRAAQQRLAIARANVASQGETVQIAEWRALAGLATELDVDQARTTLEQTRSTIPSLESTRAEAEHHLAVLTGRPAGSLRPTLAEAKPLPAAPNEIAVGIPADALRQRPDVRAAEFTLQAEIARTAEREADRYPNLTLSGSFGWQAFSAAALGGSDAIVSSLVGGLAQTLFDGGRITSRIAVQNAVQEQALIAYEKSLLTSLEDVENALTAYAVGRERVAARQSAAASARRANDLARTLYQAGAADFQKVLDTDRTRLTAEETLASADADLLTAVIQLYKALGGGWQKAPA